MASIIKVKIFVKSKLFLSRKFKINKNMKKVTTGFNFELSFKKKPTKRGKYIMIIKLIGDVGV